MKNRIHPWQTDPHIEILYFGESSDSVWTLVMPIFNQESSIKTVLTNIFRDAEYKFNVILIDDASDDNSIKIVKEFISQNNDLYAKKIGQITLVTNEFPIYETACDNIGFKMAETSYIIEFQSDIHIFHRGFDRVMLSAMKHYDLAAVSGRHVHNYSLIDGRLSWLKYPLKKLQWLLSAVDGDQGVGRLGSKIFTRLNECPAGVCYIGETVARGPWLVNKLDLMKLNYLDESNFFLGNDDHDYHRRAYQQLNKLVAYTPLNIYSIESQGSTRKKRTGINLQIFEYLRENKFGSEGFKKFMKNYKPYFKIKEFKI